MSAETEFPLPLALLRTLAGPSGLILAADAARLGLQRELRRELERGVLVRLRRGVYMVAAEWSALKPDARYLRRVHAHAAMSAEPPVYSHYSAAALWGLPIIGAWPSNIHLATAAATGGRSSHGVIRHPHEDDVEVSMRSGLQATSVAATAVAMARILPFGHAVAVVDAAIHVPRHGHPLATQEQLESEVIALGRVSGCAAARRAVDFATNLSGSAGESLSRANMFLLGFQIPSLQVPFFDHAGLIGYPDFFWRTINLVGEFDGFGKYLRHEFTQGRPTADIVIAEKLREDRLRAVGMSVCRWGWSTANSLPEFAAFLTRTGVPRIR